MERFTGGNSILANGRLLIQRTEDKMKRLSRFDTINYLQFNQWSDLAIEALIELRNIVDYLHQKNINLSFTVDYSSNSTKIHWHQSGLGVTLWVKCPLDIESNMVKVKWLDESLNIQEEDFFFKCFNPKVKPFLCELLTSKGVVEPIIKKYTT